MFGCDNRAARRASFRKRSRNVGSLEKRGRRETPIFVQFPCKIQHRSGGQPLEIGFLQPGQGLQRLAPGGKVGAAVARLMGRDPATEIREDLRRFKRVDASGRVVVVGETQDGINVAFAFRAMPISARFTTPCLTGISREADNP